MLCAIAIIDPDARNRLQELEHIPRVSASRLVMCMDILHLRLILVMMKMSLFHPAKRFCLAVGNSPSAMTNLKYGILQRLL